MDNAELKPLLTAMVDLLLDLAKEVGELQDSAAGTVSGVAIRSKASKVRQSLEKAFPSA